MSELGEGDELSVAHLSLRFLHQSALFGGEHVVRVNYLPRLDEHAVLGLSECHKISLLDIEDFEHVPRNHHLAPLADATDPLFGCG